LIPGSSNILVWAYGSSSTFATHVDRGWFDLDLAVGSVGIPKPTTPLLPFYVASASLGCVILLGLLLTQTPALRDCACTRMLFLQRLGRPGTRIPFAAELLDFTVGKALVLAIHLCSCFAFVALYVRYTMNANPWASAFGWCTTLSLALVALPVTRSSLWLHVFGLPFERAVQYHRVAGMLSVLAGLVHAVQIVLTYGGTVLIHTSVVGAAVPLYGFLAFLCMLVMASLAIPPIRRKYFELFYYSHHIFVAVFVLTLLHNDSLLHRALILAPLTVYLFPLIWSALKPRLPGGKVTVRSAEIVEGALRLVLVKVCGAKWNFEPGSYCFLNVPGVSRMQWHPFSLCCARGSDTATFVIKDMGVGTYTNQLHQYFMSAPLYPQVSIDGPYGKLALRVEEYQKVVLFAGYMHYYYTTTLYSSYYYITTGGVGITPMVSVALSLLAAPGQVKHITLVWCVQTQGALQWLSEELAQLHDSDAATVFVYVTRGTVHDAKAPSFVLAGRPDLKAIFDMQKGVVEMAALHKVAFSKVGAAPGGRVAVLACGPASMVNSVQTYCHDTGLDFHKETFEL
jgi:predicted ferric reductase